jgi:hypothetical protein
MAIDQEYVSSGSQNGERDSVKKGKEESSSNRDQGLSDEEQGSSLYEELEGNARRPRPIRKSRKTPFSLSPPPNPRSHFSFPRQYKFDESYVELDEDFDTILERQRAVDQNSPTEDKSVSKRKREVLSDQDHRLRKERTDDLVEGLRRVRENVRSEGLRDARLQRGAEEKGELFDHVRLEGPRNARLRREAEEKGELFGSTRNDEDRGGHGFQLADMRQVIQLRAIDLMNTTPIDGGFSPHELIYGTPIASPVSSGKVGDKEKNGAMAKTRFSARRSQN